MKVNDRYLYQMKFSTWHQVFQYLTDKIIKKPRRKKLILFFDEIQWMASGRSKLISILKFFWDNYWKEKNVMLVLCGSIASFMVKNVIRSKALYGRINEEILLRGLKPNEAFLLFKGKRKEEGILKYLMIFGGVPKYIEEIVLNRSFNQNMNSLCFKKNAAMISEIEKIFYSQFRETQTYLRIANLLSEKVFSAKEIGETLKISSGGGLKMYLENLEQAEIIQSFVPFGKKLNSRLKKYSLADEFIIFYLRYIAPSKQAISAGNIHKLFEEVTGDSLNIYFGFAFERFIRKNAYYIASKMGFGDQVLYASPHYERGNNHFQIDLIYKRVDNVLTVCEIKHHKREIGTEIIPEFQRKLDFLKVPKGVTVEKALISLYGQDTSLKKSEFFNHSISVGDIFQ